MHTRILKNQSRRTFLTSMTREPLCCWVLALLLVLTGALREGRAQTNSPSHRSNRYLLVVETSHSMQKRVDGVLQSVQDLLVSNMGGQLKNGDTVGIWTYSEELSAGRLPVQRWSGDVRQAVTDRILAFLKAQKYEKQGRFEKILPPLTHLVKSSDVLTVILISGGSDEIHGTPFDDRINGVFKLWRTQQQDAHMPFVIILRALRGEFTDCSVNPAPWVVDLPPLPPEPQRAKAAAKAAVVTAQKPPPSTLPPLIISGKKPDAQPSVKSAETIQAQTQSTIPGAVPDTVGQQLASPAPAIPPTIPPQTALGSPTPAPAVPANASALVQEGPKPNSAVADKTEAPQVIGGPQHSDSEQNGTLKNPVVPPPVLAPPPAGQSVPSVRQNAQPASPSASTTNAPSTQVAAVVPKNSFPGFAVLWIAALFLLVAIASLLVWFWRSRARTGTPSSLITQSLDRDRK